MPEVFHFTTRHTIKAYLQSVALGGGGRSHLADGPQRSLDQTPSDMASVPAVEVVSDTGLGPKVLTTLLDAARAKLQMSIGQESGGRTGRD